METKDLGEEVFNLLKNMEAAGTAAHAREVAIAKIALRENMNSDALRARARRYAARTGQRYPLMRQPAAENRADLRETRRAERQAFRDQRLQVGQAAKARGASWAEIAALFGIETPEGAAQWWRRNA